MKYFYCCFDISNMILPVLTFASVALSGCYVTTLDCEGPGCMGSEIGGHYYIQDLDAGGLHVIANDFMDNSRGDDLFLEGGDSIGLSISIKREKIKRDVTWPYMLNIFPASFTLTVWPIIVPKDSDRYSIEIVSILGSDVVNVDVKKTRWESVLSPLALLPIPFADESVCHEEKADEKKIADVSAEVASRMVVGAVKSTLRKDRYYAYWARKRMAERDEALRSFAMKEAPEIWQIVQDLRYEISRMDENINMLRNELVGFGRDPDADDDLKHLVKLQSNMKAEIVSLYQKLQDACLAAKKYEAMPGRKGYEELRRKTIEDGIQEAEMVLERFREMGKNK